MSTPSDPGFLDSSTALHNEGTENTPEGFIPRTLLKHFYAIAEMPQSQHLPHNPFPVDTCYDAYPTKAELLGTWLKTADIEAMQAQPPKTDLLVPGNPNIGWKLHLNISPDDTQATLNYLANSAYDCKYLGGPLGGNRVAAGKVFTVYIGSYEKSVNVATELSEALSAVLRRPEAKDDIEFARGIVGRFCAPLDAFTRTGTHGLVYDAYEYDRANREGRLEHQGVIEQLELSAIRELHDRYGQYFSG